MIFPGYNKVFVAPCWVIGIKNHGVVDIRCSITHVLSINANKTADGSSANSVSRGNRLYNSPCSDTIEVDEGITVHVCS